MIEEKRWDKSFEKELYESWKKNKDFQFNENTDKEVFSIDTPPPYVNRPVHIGQATTYVMMDFFARFQRMIGKEVLFPLGLDRNGLPIEMEAEKRLGKSLFEVPRDVFVNECQKVLNESSLASVDSFYRLGISFNSWDLGSEIGARYHTDSEEYRKLTQETFIDLYNKGLIYEDNRINNYCPGCRTTLADSEIEYVQKETFFNYIIFKVKETGESLEIGTTRPELLASCGMVIFNPDDKRYKHLEGKTAITPLYNKEIPIKAHPSADPNKGTGLVMMCSAGDLTDIRFFREQNLEPIISIGEDGKMNSNAGFLEGLTVKEAREKIISLLKEKNLLTKQEKIMHRTPICERSKHEVEFIAMPEFYLKQLDFKEKLLEESQKLNFFDEASRQILIDWINSVSIDWPISRRRVYATEIPLWKCQNCGKYLLPEKGKYHQPWKEEYGKPCPYCNSTNIVGETRVFDTWFDSSNTGLWVIGYGRNNSFFNKHFPTTLRPQGKEIIRTWLYYSLLKTYLLTGKIAFRDVWINYHILDDKGHKMSKSKGNIVDPKEILDKYGAEPFRLWTATEGNLTKKDFRISYAKIEAETKTLTKLWNIARFISRFEEPSSSSLLEIDKWILSELSELISYTKEKYKEYDFHTPILKLKTFMWETFASHYLEIIKPRVYNDKGEFTQTEQNAAYYTMHQVLKNLLLLFNPVIPFITEILFSKLYNKKITSFPFPEPFSYKTSLQTKEIISFNNYVWKLKKEKNISLRAEIKGIEIPENLKAIEKDLKLMHNIVD